MFSMFFKWKAFQVDLGWVKTWLKSNGGVHYAGLTADDNGVTVWFKQEPEEQIKAAIMQAEAAITQEEMASSVAHRMDLAKALVAAKANIPVLQWDTMLPAERKLVMSQELSGSDMEALLAKYP